MFDTLTQDLMQYNGTIFKTVDSIRVEAVQPVALTLLAIMFYFEFMNTKQMYQDGGGDLELAFFAPIIMRYIFAYFGVMGAGFILQGFLALVHTITTNIQDVSGMTDWGGITLPDIKVSGSLWEKAVQSSVWIVAFLFAIIGTVVGKVLVFMMYMSLYIFYGISPLLLATLVSEEHRQIGVMFLKLWTGTALLGPVLAVALIALSALGGNNAALTAPNFGENWASLSPAIATLLQGIGMTVVIGSAGATAMKLVRS